MKYKYGSSPVNNYNYVSFIKHIAPMLPQNDLVFLHDGSDKWRNSHDRIPISLFRSICHWKSPRRFREVTNNTRADINKHWNNALQLLDTASFENNVIRCALKELKKLKGVAIPTASALLTAWNPNRFGIMDFRVLDVLGMPDRSSIKSYLAFRDKLLKLKRDHSELSSCSLRQIELALWHYYPIKKEVRNL